MPVSATRQLQAATRESEDARASAPLQSRGWRSRRRARRARDRWWHWHEVAQTLSVAFREQLVAEAAERVALREPRDRLWHRPDVAQVLAEVRQVSPYVLAHEDSVAHIIYRDHLLELEQTDLELVRQHARDLSDDVFAVLQRRSYVSKPNGGDMFLDSELVAALASQDAALPRPVTVWRGEHPTDRAPSFAAEVREAVAGDILHRPIPISCSMDPAVAATAEFSHIPLITAARDDTAGWLLEITTDHLLYAGDREERSGLSDGNAKREKEALIHTPRLRVTGQREALVQGRWGLKRAHVVSCKPA